MKSLGDLSLKKLTISVTNRNPCGFYSLTLSLPYFCNSYLCKINFSKTFLGNEMQTAGEFLLGVHGKKYTIFMTSVSHYLHLTQ